jgi:hypothetical protein
VGECSPVNVQAIIIVVVTSVIAGYVFLPFANLWWKLINCAVSWLDRRYIQPVRERKRERDYMKWFDSLPGKQKQQMQELADSLSEISKML